MIRATLISEPIGVVMAGPDLQLWLVNERLAELRGEAERELRVRAARGRGRWNARVAFGRLLIDLGERLAGDGSGLARSAAVQQ
jgi:hypothetical protein